MFEWQLLNNKISTKDNLLHRGILHDSSNLCLRGCKSNKYVDRLFFQCDWFDKIWILILNWIDIYGVVAFFCF